jgi:hypothetical protein
MLFQWISIHVESSHMIHIYNYSTVASIRNAMVSQFFVRPTSKKQFLKRVTSDHETWSIWCHVRIHVSRIHLLCWPLKRSVNRTWTGSTFSTNESARSAIVTGPQFHVWSGLLWNWRPHDNCKTIAKNSKLPSIHPSTYPPPFAPIHPWEPENWRQGGREGRGQAETGPGGPCPLKSGRSGGLQSCPWPVRPSVRRSVRRSLLPALRCLAWLPGVLCLPGYASLSSGNIKHRAEQSRAAQHNARQRARQGAPTPHTY